MPRRITTVTVGAVFTAIALFGLTACTGAPAGSSSSGGSSAAQPADAAGDGGQSTEQACALVQDSITEATDGFENAGDDPAAVVDAMNVASEKLASTASQVTNDQVAALVPSLQEMFAKASDVMAALVSGDTSKLEDLSQLSTDFQQTSEKFQELCTP